MSNASAEGVETALTSLSSITNNRVFPLLLETFLYAISVVLILVSSFILVKRGLSKPANKAMLFVTIVMFALSTTSWACDVTLLWNDLKVIIPADLTESLDIADHAAHALRVNAPWEFTGALANSFCTVISDAVVVWRAWVVCERDKRFAIVAGVMLVGLLVDTILLEIASAAIYLPTSTSLSSMAKHGLNINLAWFILSAAINILSTMFIGYKAWRHRKDVRQFVSGPSKNGFRVERILIVIVDTGIIYVLFWIIATILTNLEYFNTGNHGIVSGLSTYLFYSVLYQFTGLYPTAIIILVALQKSQIETQFTYGGISAELGTTAASTTLSEFVAQAPGTLDALQSTTNLGECIVSHYSITDEIDSKRYAHTGPRIAKCIV